jgi:soluble cytochrome b562
MKKTVTLGLALVALCGLAASTSVGFQPEGTRQVRAPGGQPVDPAQFVARMMELDTNGDGKISREEAAESPFARGFDRFDANTDGFIDKAELETFSAQRGQRPGQIGQGPGAAAGEVATFDQNMGNSGRAMRRLSRSEFTAESRAGDLAALQQMQTALIAAKAQVSTVHMSDNAKAKFGDDAAAYQAEFQTYLIRAVKESLDLEMAVIQGNSAAAVAARMRLEETRNQAHDIFEHEEEG